jgi:hypothetical protein
MTNLLDRFPPEAVLTDKQVCELVGISLDTLWRLEHARENCRRLIQRKGPPGVRTAGLFFGSNWRSI